MRKYSAGTHQSVTGNRNTHAVEVVEGRSLAVLSAAVCGGLRQNTLLACASGRAAGAVELLPDQVSRPLSKRELAQPSKSAQCDLLISRSHCNVRRYKHAAVGGAARD
jgi:hypothetical protein